MLTDSSHLSGVYVQDGKHDAGAGATVEDAGDGGGLGDRAAVDAGGGAAADTLAQQHTWLDEHPHLAAGHAGWWQCLADGAAAAVTATWWHHAANTGHSPQPASGNYSLVSVYSLLSLWRAQARSSLYISHFNFDNVSL